MSGSQNQFSLTPRSAGYIRCAENQFPTSSFSINSIYETQLQLFQGRLFCAVALGIGSSFSLIAAPEASGDTAPAKTSQAIPWSQIGAKAGADYQGDRLAVIPTAEGARLRCVFQRLEGEATREGLWLTSIVTNAMHDRFRIVAATVGRQSPIVGN